jgi:alpha-glucoside transport system substrate-binding protein
MRKSTWMRAFAIVAVLGLVAVGCGGDEEGETGATSATGATADLSGETVEVAATWTSSEKDNFEQVLAAFEEQTGADVRFLSAGDDVAAFLGPKIEGGQPPDVAILPQPGVLQSFVEQGDLIEIEDVAGDEIDENYGEVARQIGSVDDTLYGVWFRTANKSTVWYNVNVFTDAGVEPPADWDALQTTAQTISDFGVTPYSLGAGDGWTLSDLFENIYIRSAGIDMYDQLAAHEIPWTDQSVKDALTLMADVIGDDALIAGGISGALQTDFNGSITQVYADPPDGSIIFGLDAVGGIIAGETEAQVGPDADWFTFPTVEGSDPAVVGGGDLAVLLKDSPGGKALIEFLATPEAGEIWAALGGFTSPNLNVDPSVYPDEQSQRAAQELANAGDSLRYDLSDLQPTEFGATTGQGIWGILQAFMESPGDVDGIAQQLEDAANAAYGQ